MMTMIASDAHDIDKKLQELEDEEIRSIMKERGYSEDDIKKAINNTRLHVAINRLEDILCEPDEMMKILLENGWRRKEIEEVLEQRKK